MYAKSSGSISGVMMGLRFLDEKTRWASRLVRV
jgi:hypothetical protein